MNKLTKLGLSAALAVGISMPATADTELTMYYPIAVGGALTEVVDSIVADFEAENPDIKVNAIYSGNYDDTRVRALSALNSGDPAQLAVMFSIDAYDLIEQDLILPFDDVVSGAEGANWLKSFYPALMANGNIEGKTWGIPFQRSTIVAYYNKDMFRAAGLDPESPPTSWDELISMGKALTKDGAYGIMIPSTGYPYWMFQALAIQNGKEVMSNDGLTTYFDDPTVVETLEFWKSLSSEHGVMPGGTVEWGTLRQAFLEGQTAMMWHSTGNLTAVKKNASFDFGVAELPANVRKGSPTGGGNFYIFKDTSAEEQAAALKLIQFMTSAEQAAAWSIATGYMGVSPAAYKTDALKSYTVSFPPALVARNQLEHAVAEFSTFETARVREGLNNAIQSALTGSKSAADALGEAQAAAERLLKDYR
ncbi:MAG: ABC transporter substrate-binding protein [Paracoccaceae bacterium]|jgi:sn-glycerol 3-phosphate transport system substrate-binding protein|nr:ABC transporter substrate-binding protein [Cryomorphaceae bacterium]MDG1155331.1 ABC transporter substrate-binding protein [Paracoccaceae bacterium]MDG1764782.1 ABC transporter substrate-binding protein [Paracoccaceae bacterium]MDG2430590.1 ABC transporter substrate-binding protein [Paracoccaceae bacterium]|tara:strand:+ start:1119 stop:2381 length:1263 start_codon:yes stop_codon:yes gene_type:complete